MTEGERGWGALPYIPTFFFDISNARPRFSMRTVRACEYLFPLGMRVSIRFARVAMRNVNYIMRISFRAIATVSNVSRRGVLNILNILR